MDGISIILCIFLGLILGLFLGGWCYNWGGVDDIEMLGQSICEEEYGMDFESYIDNTLRCKPFTESYDGIKVEVPKGVD